MPSEKCRVLCVEDDEDTRYLLELLLCEHEVTTASTADEGLALARCENFDLYVLDYWMGGLELCRRLRASDPKTPLIFFTAEAHEAERQKALAAGADAYLIKPNDLELLAYRVKQLLPLGCQVAA